MIVALQCPECDRLQAYSGHGMCRCGAYLIDHMSRPKYILGDKDRTWIRYEREWLTFEQFAASVL